MPQKDSVYLACGADPEHLMSKWDTRTHNIQQRTWWYVHCLGPLASWESTEALLDVQLVTSLLAWDP